MLRHRALAPRPASDRVAWRGRATAWVLAVSACGAQPRLRRPPAVAHASAWRATLTEPLAVGRLLLGRGADGAWWTHDPATGRPGTRVADGDLRVLAEASTEELVVGAEAGPWLRAVAPASGRVLWRARCHAGDEQACSVVGRQGGGALVFAGLIELHWVRQDTPGSGLARTTEGVFALEAATGRELWRRPLRGYTAMPSWVEVDDARVYVVSDGGVWALERATGATAWTRASDGATMRMDTRPVARGDGLLAYASAGSAPARQRVHVVEAATGEECSRIDWTGTVGAMHLARGVLYVAARAASTPELLAAYDARSGRRWWAYRPALDEQRRWSADVLGARFERLAYLALVHRAPGDARAAPADEVHAVDLATGARVWSQPLGTVRALALVPRSGALPIVVGQLGERESVALRPGAREPPPRRVEVTGTVRWHPGAAPIPNVRVRVGAETAVTDARGAFRVLLVARGPVLVAPVDPPPPPDALRSAGTLAFARPTFVYVDALRDRYEATATVEVRDPR